MRFRASIAGLFTMALALMTAVAAVPATAAAPHYVPGQVIVQYAPGPLPRAAADAQRTMGIRTATEAVSPNAQVLKRPQT